MPSPKETLRDAVSRARIAARPRSRLQALIPHGPRPTVRAPWPDIDNAPLGPGELHQLLDAHTGHVVHKWRHYPDVYADLLTKFRAGFPVPGGQPRPLRFLEIGVSEGGSLEFWREWFGPQATIFGIDIEPSCAGLVSPETAQIRIGSQDDPAFLQSVVDEMGGVDLVLDDGSHYASHQKASFEALWPHLPEGGRYLIEDVHTAYWPGFEGGLRRPGTAIEEAKDLVDDMHRWYYTVEGDDQPRRPRRDDVWSVTFYDSIIAIDKRQRQDPRRVARGTEQRPAAQL